MKPVKKHVAPGYPSYAVAAANPALLEKLPSRWRENAKVLACVGMVGTLALAGCVTSKQAEPVDPVVMMANVIKNNHAMVQMHHGGTIGNPYYVVYITEQDALSVMRAEANVVGLALSEPYKPSLSENEKAFHEHLKILGNTMLILAEYTYKIDFGDDINRYKNPIKSKILREAFAKSKERKVSWDEFLRLYRE